MTNPLRNPRLQLMLVVALITGVGSYLWLVSSYTPNRETMALSVAHEANLIEINKKNRAIISQIGLSKIRLALDRYRQQASHVARLVPTDTETHQPLLTALTAAAANGGVRLQDIKPLPSGLQNDFVTEGYTMNVTGRYHDVGALLASILSMGRITQIQKVVIHAVPLTASDAASGAATPPVATPQGRGYAPMPGPATPPGGLTVTTTPSSPGGFQNPTPQAPTGAGGAAAPVSAPEPTAYGVQATFDVIGFLASSAQPKPAAAAPATPAGPPLPGAKPGAAAGAPPAPGAKAPDAAGAPGTKADTGDEVIVPKRRRPPVAP